MRNFLNKIEENYHQAILVSNVNDIWTNQVCRRVAACVVIMINKIPITPNVIATYLAGVKKLVN